jgi:hypothetical protein
MHFDAICLGGIDDHDGTSVVVDAYAFRAWGAVEVAVHGGMIVRVVKEHLEPSANGIHACTVLVLQTWI